MKVKYALGIPPDPGSKAAGFLVRKYVKNSEEVLAIHGNVEPPNLFYYFGRSQHSFFDLSFNQAIDQYYRLKDHVDVIVCSDDQASVVEVNNDFRKKVVIYSEGEPKMLIYARPHVEIPVMRVDAQELNGLFDREYIPRVSLR